MQYSVMLTLAGGLAQSNLLAQNQSARGAYLRRVRMEEGTCWNVLELKFSKPTASNIALVKMRLLVPRRNARACTMNGCGSSAVTSAPISFLKQSREKRDSRLRLVTAPAADLEWRGLRRSLANPD